MVVLLDRIFILAEPIQDEETSKVCQKHLISLFKAFYFLKVSRICISWQQILSWYCLCTSGLECFFGLPGLLVKALCTVKHVGASMIPGF